MNYDSENCLKVLLKYGADPELQCTGNDYTGMTALELSVRRRRRNCTAIIKEHTGFVPNNK